MMSTQSSAITWASNQPAARLAASVVLLATFTSGIASTTAAPLPIPGRKRPKFGEGGGATSPKFYYKYESGTVNDGSKTIDGIWVPYGDKDDGCAFWSSGKALPHFRESCAQPSYQWWVWAGGVLALLLVVCCMGRKGEEDDQAEEKDEEQMEGKNLETDRREGQAEAAVGTDKCAVKQ